MPHLACTLPSLYLVSVVFGTAILTSLYIFEFVHSFIVYTIHSFLKEDVVLVSFFERLANKYSTTAAFCYMSRAGSKKERAEPLKKAQT